MIRPWKCPTPICDSDDHKHLGLDDSDPGPVPDPDFRTFVYNCDKYYRHHPGRLRFILKKDSVVVHQQDYDHYSIGQSCFLRTGAF